MLRAALYAAALSCLPACGGESVLHQQPSASGTLYVTQDTEGLRTLRFDKKGMRQSVAMPGDPARLEMPYLRVALAGFALCGEPRRILIVGMGGGTLASFLHVYYPEAAIDAVEIDPQVVQVAKRYFGFREDARLRAHVADGRDFVEKAPGGFYDVIVLDAFGQASVPRRLTTLEFLQAVRRALAPGGVAIGNLWKQPYNPLHAAMLRTYREAFAEITLLDVEGSGNQIVLALPRSDSIGREELVRRARGLGRQKGFRYDVGALVETGYVQPPRSGPGTRPLRDADFE